MPSTSSESLISLDLGGTKLLGVVIDANRQILVRELRASPQGAEPVKDAILQLIADLQAKAAAARVHPTGIALCAPGFIDPQAGVMVDAENLAVKHLPILSAIHERYPLPARLFHDVKSATLAEALYGAGAGRQNFGLLNIGTGIAVGLFLDGKIYLGSHGRSGELGHAALGLDQVSFNRRLEAVASGPALARTAAKDLAAHPDSIIFQFAGEDPGHVTPLLIHAAACANDPWASELIETCANAIGMVVGALQDVLELECIILSGGMAQMGEVFSHPIQAAINRYAIEPVPLIPSALNGDAGVIGAAAYYYQSGGE